MQPPRSLSLCLVCCREQRSRKCMPLSFQMSEKSETIELMFKVVFLSARGVQEETTFVCLFVCLLFFSPKAR